MTLTIGIFDDEVEQRRDWTARLEMLGKYTVTPINDVLFKTEIENLEKRRRVARDRKGVSTLEDLSIPSSFDDLDIFFVDYDLLLETDLTGEEIAYLLRCYSTCGVVVALNQFGSKNFDLTLTRHPESFADLNLDGELFDDPGLWEKSGWKEFRPWQWPLLPKLHQDFESRARDLAGRMHEPILEFLGLDQDKAGILPYVTLEFIQSSKGEVGLTTFDAFVLRSKNGLRKRDAEGVIEELKPRIAAARLYAWLENFVLNGQEVLVDAPHLASRFPSLLEGSAEDPKSWNRTARLDAAEGLNIDLIEASDFPQKHWISRPAWYWNQVRNQDSIPEVSDPWSTKAQNLVFCEDTSTFLPREKVRSFASSLPSNFSRRYVEKLESIDYHPGVRFSL